MTETCFLKLSLLLFCFVFFNINKKKQANGISSCFGC